MNRVLSIFPMSTIRHPVYIWWSFVEVVRNVRKGWIPSSCFVAMFEILNGEKKIQMICDLYKNKPQNLNHIPRAYSIVYDEYKVLNRAVHPLWYTVCCFGIQFVKERYSLTQKSTIFFKFNCKWITFILLGEQCDRFWYTRIIECGYSWNNSIHFNTVCWSRWLIWMFPTMYNK